MLTDRFDSYLRRWEKLEGETQGSIAGEWEKMRRVRAQRVWVKMRWAPRRIATCPGERWMHKVHQWMAKGMRCGDWFSKEENRSMVGVGWWVVGVGEIRGVKVERWRCWWFSGLIVPEFENLRIWEFENLRIWEFENLRIWEPESLRVWESESLRVWESESLRVWESESLRVCRF